MGWDEHPGHNHQETAMSTMASTTFPFAVVAELLPGKQDPSSRAQFANAGRAGQYAQMLADTGDYAAVYVEESGTRHQVNGSAS